MGWGEGGERKITRKITTKYFRKAQNWKGH